MTIKRHTSPNWRSFLEARAFVRSKGVTSHADWLRYCRSGEKPDDIPTNPNQTYKAEWRGLGDWLGTGAVATQDRRYRSFQAARAFVRSKGLTNQAEWRAFCRSGDKPDDIPAAPQKVYKAEWRGLGDLVGATGKWTKQALLAFLEDLRPKLSDLDEREQYEILQQGGADARTPRCARRCVTYGRLA